MANNRQYFEIDDDWAPIDSSTIEPNYDEHSRNPYQQKTKVRSEGPISFFQGLVHRAHMSVGKIGLRYQRILVVCIFIVVIVLITLSLSLTGRYTKAPASST